MEENSDDLPVMVHRFAPWRWSWPTLLLVGVPLFIVTFIALCFAMDWLYQRGMLHGGAAPMTGLS